MLEDRPGELKCLNKRNMANTPETMPNTESKLIEKLIKIKETWQIPSTHEAGFPMSFTLFGPIHM